MGAMKMKLESEQILLQAEAELMEANIIAEASSEVDDHASHVDNLAPQLEPGEKVGEFLRGMPDPCPAVAVGCTDSPLRHSGVAERPLPDDALGYPTKEVVLAVPASRFLDDKKELNSHHQSCREQNPYNDHKNVNRNIPQWSEGFLEGRSQQKLTPAHNTGNSPEVLNGWSLGPVPPQMLDGPVASVPRSNKNQPFRIGITR